MRYRLLIAIICMVIFISSSPGIQNKPIVISPFVDLSFDVGPDNWYYYPYYYGYSSRNGPNLSLGMNVFRKPLYLQLQISNYLNYLNNEGDVYGIAKVGMFEEMYKNGYFEMNFSYTDNLSQYNRYAAYSGSVGYYHLFMPIDTLSSACFSFGINLGFSNYNYWNHCYSWWYYPESQTEVFTIAELAWINKYFRPYIAFGLQNLVGNDYIYPRNSGFFSIGVQAQITNILPYFSGSQTKLTYNNHGWREIVNVFKPNIYLYPESILPAKVKLLPQKNNEITVSIPPYNNGWDVIINPNSIIDNQYEYLFYEGKLTKKPINEFGWSVSASDLWQFLPEKMSEYGFNEKEIKDFVDYWTTHLPKNNFYDIIPLVNQEIENEFSLVVEPKPEAILRVWFYINPTDIKTNLQPPTVAKFDRNGFTVTEWGVLLAK